MGARTKRIRFRTAVVLAPLYDPIKLAEDAAVTQLATGGRLLLGIGGGYRYSLPVVWQIRQQYCRSYQCALYNNIATTMSL